LINPEHTLKFESNRDRKFHIETRSNPDVINSSQSRADSGTARDSNMHLAVRFPRVPPVQDARVAAPDSPAFHAIQLYNAPFGPFR
jgi:hypothetical protein